MAFSNCGICGFLLESKDGKSGTGPIPINDMQPPPLLKGAILEYKMGNVLKLMKNNFLFFICQDMVDFVLKIPEELGTLMTVPSTHTS